MWKQTHTHFFSCKHLKNDYKNKFYPYKRVMVPLKLLSSRDLGLLQENIYNKVDQSTDMVCIGITLQDKMEDEGSWRKETVFC